MENKRKFIALNFLSRKCIRKWRNYGPYKEREKEKKKNGQQKLSLRNSDTAFIDDTSYQLF